MARSLFRLAFPFRRIRIWTIVKVFLVFAFCFIFYEFYVSHTDRISSTEGKPRRIETKDSVQSHLFDYSVNKSNEPVFSKGVLGNFEPRDLPPRSGPGEYGQPVTVTKEEQEQAQALIHEYGFNMIASDKVAMYRYIKDTRPDECKYWNYPAHLPTASVVLVFFNEPWSVLIRTMHSVVETSPKHLMKQIVLVDDMSSKDFLKEKLDRYCEETWPKGFVKIVRNDKREGLITARTIGARHATADVVIFLDAHCECVLNWLPPLLTRIAINRRAVAVPIVDGIDWNTMEHTSIYGTTTLFRGIWEWGFFYKEKEVPQKERARHTHASEPYWSPTHAGGLLAIERKWFFELGGYDPGLKIWGAEQYELSFKTWQCGGVVEWVPCSHVAHYYRGPRRVSVHVPGTDGAMIGAVNHMRVVEVWMGEYGEYFYRREPWHKGHYMSKLGDISEQVAVRERLQCKPFSWFMENIAYDVTERFPVPPENKVWGELSCPGKSVCVDSMGKLNDYIGVYACHHGGGSQRSRLNVEGEWSTSEHCFIGQNGKVHVRMCIQGDKWIPKGEWDYDESTKLMKSKALNQCLQTDGHELVLASCDSNNVGQQWKWNHV